MVNRAATFALAATLSMPAAWAQSGYRINDLSAPQVLSNPIASQLEEQLKTLQSSLRQRATSVELQQTMEAGLLNNPELAAAYAQIQGQQWNLIAVRRQWYPTARAGTIPYALGQIFNTTTQSASPPSADLTNYNNRTDAGMVNLNLGWTFFDPSRGANINAASESLKRQQLLFDVSARNLTLQIQDSYFALQEQQQLISSYEEILAATNRQVAATEAQFNSGLVSIADVEQIRTQQYSNLTALINAYRQLINASAQVARIMALPPGELVLPAEQLIPMGSWDESLESTIEQALKLREEIKASLAQAASFSWQATSLFNNYWPRFNIGASGSYSSFNRTSGLPGDSVSANSRSLVWDGGVGVGFTWQLFDGGISAADAENRKALARAAMDQAANDRLQITQEVEQNYSDYLTNQLALESTKAQANSARAAATAVRARFAAGVTDMASVVQILNLALNAANYYATAVRGYNRAVAGLYRSSARWPATSKQLLQQRVQQLQQR